MAQMNVPQNRMVVELLEVRRNDQVLEIGFGPGTALKMLAERASAGFVAGIELSDEMIRAAIRRNRDSIQRGRLELKRGTVSAIPYDDYRFDKVCTANTIYFWPEPERDSAEIRRVMHPGGTLVVCFRGELLRANGRSGRCRLIHSRRWWKRWNTPVSRTSAPKCAKCRW